jgi:adenylyl-sulfate kinase
MSKILWFTGLSGSGKTTIANIVKEKLETKNKIVKILDGDVVRDQINKHLGFTKEDILENNRIIMNLCHEAIDKVDFILVPIISPFRQSRNEAKERFKEKISEVFIGTSLKECISRDVKGLYKKALNGEIENFIGISSPYEEPLSPDIFVDTEKNTPEESADVILSHLDA